jgi:hypothetical protein
MWTCSKSLSKSSSGATQVFFFPFSFFFKASGKGTGVVRGSVIGRGEVGSGGAELEVVGVGRGGSSVHLPLLVTMAFSSALEVDGKSLLGSRGGCVCAREEFESVKNSVLCTACEMSCVWFCSVGLGWTYL